MTRTKLVLSLLFVSLTIILVACDSAASNAADDNRNKVNANNNSVFNEGKSSSIGGDELDLPDLTGETITIYLIGDTSESYSVITGPIRDGASDYLAYLNANGGIFGATIELRFADTGGSEEGVITAYERFTGGEDNIPIIILHGLFEEIVYERANEDHIPVLAFGLSPHLTGDIEGSYVFRLMPTYAEQFAFFLDFVLNQWEDVRPEGVDQDIRVAYLSWGNEYGQSALSEETRAYAESLGIEIVWEETYDMSTTASITTALLNAETAGATVIYTNTHGFGPAFLLNDLNNLGLRNFFVVGGNNWALENTTFAFLADPGYADGLFAPMWYAGWSDNENPAILLAEEVFTANNRAEQEKTASRLLIQGSLDLAQYVIEQAILDVDYENLTGEDVYEVLSQLSGYEVMGGLFTVDYSDGKRSPTMLQMRRVQGDSFDVVPVGEVTDIPELIP